MYFSLCTLVANISKILCLCHAISPPASNSVGKTGPIYYLFTYLFIYLIFNQSSILYTSVYICHWD